MSEKYLLALDAGTGSVRAVLFNLEGEQIGCAQKEWRHNEDPRYPGSMDFDWNANWDLALHCIRKVIADSRIAPSSIAAISTTCMREGIVLYDTEGAEIWACANVDARSADEVGELKLMDSELEREIYSTSGQTYALGALPRILWVKNKLPEVYRKTAHVSMFNDWLIYRMTGILASEPSNGCTTGIFNLQRREWDTSIAERVGLKADIFPPVIECGELAGKVTAACAGATGLAEGTPVVMGGGDAQMGCIGVGVTSPAQAAVFGGSFWQYEFNTATGATDPGCRVRVNCHGIPGIWQFEAIAFKPGLAMRWFRDAFCQDDIMRAKAAGKDPYELMDEEAAKIPVGSYGMMCAFSDVMNYISWRHAAPTFTNFDFDPEKFTKYTFYRSIMENAALVTKGHLELVREATGSVPAEIVFAGGAAKSPLWCQMLADVLGLTVKVPVVKEATALGTAILAGYGAGIYTDISGTARRLVRWEREYVPDRPNHAAYEMMYAKWREIYAAQLALSDRRVTRYMWSAPGL
ncbi:MAG: autoinducer-2 kinase [Treponema sp. GWB1_62_6]|nr:MAG: autoinducer-2 kinase [Treponema sp. GWA1_62_8]OHE64692.1 MAG: autoinducer-2 kinase [Treponema sp. GWC1_61_84]OHE72332.1 MAG: autoinducer-2 kinase [Treponema sp. GWB1_62_6]OHE75602.1 MAG: autoinducer-2 kinase [Treponema sp. RIFOXYC1_FULL_61_9]HCM27524.1 autoinducer-2 kinase [Treponema sp.]